MTRAFWSIICSFTIFLSCGRQPSEIKIGAYVSLTGSSDTYGISAKNGFYMALDEINGSNGVLGKKVNLIILDDQSRSYLAVMAVRDLIEKEKVAAILGEVVSSRSLAAAPFCQDAGIPMITPSSTHPEVTTVGDYIFRTCFIDPFQGAVMANYAYETLGLRSIATLMDLKNEYSMNLGKIFNDRFSYFGGKIIATEFYREGDSDFSTQINKIKQASPQAIFLPGYFNDVAGFVIQARKAGIRSLFLGTDGWDSPRLLETAAEQLEGSYFSNHFSSDMESQSVKKFINDYRSRYDETPDATAALAYDAAMVLFDAIERAGSTKPDEIRKALANTKEFPGVLGPITINEDRNALKPAVILKVENSRFEYIDTVFP